MYKYNEKELLKELEEYIDDTYEGHYSNSRYLGQHTQATESIMAAGHGEGFCIGNIVKYALRYGKKEGRNRQDLLKILHYGIMLVYNHDTWSEQNDED
jgi:hypothetical protein